MKKLLLTVSFISLMGSTLLAELYSVKSPDGKLQADVNVDKNIMFSLFVDEKPVVENVVISMNTDRGDMGKNSKLVKTTYSTNDSMLKTVFGITSEIKDQYNQLELDFNTFKVLFRAYDDALAYRFVSNFGSGKMKVFSETLSLPVDEKSQIITQFARDDMTSYEELFKRAKISDVAKEHSVIMPTLITKKNSPTLAIVESDVQAYPMIRFVKGKDNCLKPYIIKYPKTFKAPSGFGKNFMIAYDTFEDYIAYTEATRTFPWRAFVVARSDADLVVNTTVYKLAEASRILDTSWISTGLCVWEWWNDWCVEGVDFKTGVNEQTYRYYIDFASENKIPFILFDAGWLVGSDVGGMKPDIHERMIDGKPFLNVKKLIAYAHSKNVKVVLWCLGQSLNLYTEKSIKLMKEWGADGFKVDFFNRDDQTAMELYYKIARVAAENKMLVDFHGCAKPAGLERTYPNVVNFEAVYGLEQNKWRKKDLAVSPSHNVDLVLVRMLQGPMDYTPGAMRNLNKYNFWPNYSQPSSMTTRAHQVALYVLFYSPLQMMCDSPSEYRKYQETTDFLSSIPTTWDESKSIDAKIGEYVVLARRKGDVWYIAGITNNAKKMKIDLSKVIPEGDYTAEIFRDTVNSNKTPQSYKLNVKSVSSGESIEVSMAMGGGFVIRLTPKKIPFVSDFVRAIFE